MLCQRAVFIERSLNVRHNRNSLNRLTVLGEGDRVEGDRVAFDRVYHWHLQTSRIGLLYERSI